MKKNVERLYHWMNQEKFVYNKSHNPAIKNYFLFIVNGLLTQVADMLSNPKTILTWLMNGLGVPLMYTSLTVPIRESGSMLPQFILAEYIKNRAYRKSLWILGAMIQCCSLFGIAFAGLYTDGNILGVIIVALIVLFSLGRSLCSLVSKDIIGKVIQKKKRGKLTGYINMVSGVMVLIFAFFLKNITDNQILMVMIFAAALFWIAAVWVYAHISELPSPVQETPPSFQKSFRIFSLLKTDRVLRKFIIARALLLCSALSTPFYVILAQENYSSRLDLLAYFVLASSFAAAISSAWWGRFADRSSKMTLVYAALVSALVGFIAVIFSSYVPYIASQFYFYPLLVGIVSLAHVGVRIGRKTYVIDIAEGNQRTDYVAISNSVIGVVLLVVGFINGFLVLISVQTVILVLSLLACLGAYLSYHLPEVSH